MNDKFINPKKYNDYNQQPLDLDTVMNIYKKNQIKPIRADLYYDFTNSLCELVFSTYMGDEVSTEENKLEHFTWCWDMTVSDFFMMGYDLGDMSSKFTYFRNFFTDIFYKVENKDETLEKEILIVWEYIFNYHIKKSEKDVYNFIEIYKMFDNTNWFKN